MSFFCSYLEAVSTLYSEYTILLLTCTIVVIKVELNLP